MPLDIIEFRAVCGGNPERIATSVVRRGCDSGLVEAVVKADAEWRELGTVVNRMRQELNQLKRTIAARMKAFKASGVDLSSAAAESEHADQVARAKELRAAVQTRQHELDARDISLRTLLARVPNLLDSEFECPVLPDRGTSAGASRTKCCSTVAVRHTLWALHAAGFKLISTPPAAFLESLTEGKSAAEPLLNAHRGCWIPEAELPLRCATMRLHDAPVGHAPVISVELCVLCSGEVRASHAEMDRTLRLLQWVHASVLGGADGSTAAPVRTDRVPPHALAHSASLAFELRRGAAAPGVQELAILRCDTDFEARRLEIRSGPKKMGQIAKKYAHTVVGTALSVTCDGGDFGDDPWRVEHWAVPSTSAESAAGLGITGGLEGIERVLRPPTEGAPGGETTGNQSNEADSRTHMQRAVSILGGSARPATHEVHEALGVLEEWLAPRAYICGFRPGALDVAAFRGVERVLSGANGVKGAERMVPPVQFPHLWRWLAHLRGGFEPDERAAWA